MFKNILFIGLFAVLFSGCATSYQPSGMTGGYENSKLDANTHKVACSGNGFTAKSWAQNCFLYRAAELTNEEGYDYFIVVNQEDSTSESYVTNYSQYNSINTLNSYTSTISKPTSSSMIKMFKGKKPENNYNAFYAKDIILNLENEVYRGKKSIATMNNKEIPNSTSVGITANVLAVALSGFGAEAWVNNNGITYGLGVFTFDIPFNLVSSSRVYVGTSLNLSYHFNEGYDGFYVPIALDMFYTYYPAFHLAGGVGYKHFFSKNIYADLRATIDIPINSYGLVFNAIGGVGYKF